MLLFMFKSMLLCSLIGTVLFGVLCLIRPLTERFFSSSWHYFIGLCVMLIMIFPIRIALPESYESESRNIIYYEEKNDETEFSKSENRENGEISREKETSPFFERLAVISAYAWGLTALALLIKNEAAYAVFMHRMRRGTNEACSNASLCRKHLRIRKGSCISSPMVSGIISPTLFLPDISLSDEEMKVILSHEIIHLRRRDLILKRLIVFVRCIHFFNPFVHLLAKKIDLDCEISCDLAATKNMNDEEKHSYMLTILSLISRSGLGSSEFSVSIISGKDTLKRRFYKINNREKINKKVKALSAVVALILIISSVCVSGVLASGIKKPEAEETVSQAPTTVLSAADKTEEPPKKKNPVSEEPKTENIITTAEAELQPTESVDYRAENEPVATEAPAEKTDKVEDTTVPVVNETEKPAETSAKLKTEAPAETTDKAEATTVPVVAETEKPSETSVELKAEQFLYPCSERIVTASFGGKRNHNGVDFKAKLGSDVYASADATVIFAGSSEEAGISVTLKTASGTRLIYEHLDSLLVKKGDTVKAGQVIAKSGATGNATGPCLHFGVVINGEYKDPELYLG
ncbi:MAG: M56 family metallopeptidase [Acutalibacteraceae bacterium]